MTISLLKPEVKIMKKYSFTILVERDEDNGFIATIPELKGCHTQGDTMVELMANVEEAINLCLEVLKIDGIDVFNKDYIETKKMEMVI
jgi:predicted RNase H-like HicB family nuclease